MEPSKLPRCRVISFLCSGVQSIYHHSLPHSWRNLLGLNLYVAYGETVANRLVAHHDCQALSADKMI